MYFISTPTSTFKCACLFICINIYLPRCNPKKYLCTHTALTFPPTHINTTFSLMPHCAFSEATLAHIDLHDNKKQGKDITSWTETTKIMHYSGFSWEMNRSFPITAVLYLLRNQLSWNRIAITCTFGYCNLNYILIPICIYPSPTMDNIHVKEGLRNYHHTRWVGLWDASRLSAVYFSNSPSQLPI